MENKIKINVSKNLTRLSGRDYGKELFENFVECNLKFNQKIVIVVPQNIKNVGTSFVRGFFYAIPSKYINDGFYKHFSIQANKTVEEKFKDVIIDIYEQKLRNIEWQLSNPQWTQIK